jgi:hypothetical protein
MKTLLALAGCVLSLGLALPAAAQTIITSQPPVADAAGRPTTDPRQSPGPDGIVRVAPTPERVDKKPDAPKGPIAKMRPGGQLLTTFDANHDGVVSKAELQAGAEASFAAADVNEDGSVGGIEQGQWASGYGGASDVLSNLMLFDANLDRTVTKEEFVAGIFRLAAPAKDASGGFPVSSLMVSVETEKELTPAELQKLQGPQVAGRR